MKNILILVLISLFFSACRVSEMVSSSTNNELNNTNITLKNYTMPLVIHSSYLKTKFYIKTLSSYNVIMFRIIPNIMQEKITIELLGNIKTLDFMMRGELFENRKILDSEEVKIFDKEYTNQYPDNWKMLDYFGTRRFYDTEKYISYAKRYINFVDKLKCIVYVKLTDATRYFDKEDNITLGYSIICPYYNKAGTKHHLRISASAIKLVSEKSDEQDKWLDAQERFRMDLKEIADSLELHHMDRERMQKEELLYDKKYDILAETRAKDLSFDCKLVKKDKIIDEYRICIGKEINKICTKKAKENKWECKEK